ncbi:MAG: ferrous iron transport protein B [Desulfarculus sp.]|nr:ferrous iron transport protein B [Desulfarculus sp.]
MSQSQVTVALAGNPNAGKTSLFNALTGARQHVGNYPGVTVDKKEGEARLDGEPINIVDLPGTYSLTAYSLEEVVARNYVIGQRPDVVVDVVDASNLERNLYLAVQLMELGVPLVIGLNMVDVAEQRGMKIDPDKLSELLGVPVVPTVARTGQGVQELLRAAVDLARQKPDWRPLDISYGADLDQAIAELAGILEGSTPRHGLISARWLALKCLEGDHEVLESMRQDQNLASRLEPVRQRVGEHLKSTLDDDPESVIADYRYGFLSAITRQALVLEREVRMDFSDKVDRVLTNRLIGPLFLLGVLYGVYQFVFWASKAPVAWLETFFGWLGGAVEATLPEGLLRSLIVSGVIDGVGGVLGFVPLIMFMFLAIAVMEDSGYMARMAYLMDRVLRVFGLHGNSVISLIVGGGISGGCAVPAVMATRTLKDPQARLATILVVPFMNCGAKLPVYSLLISAFFAHRQADVMFALTIISWTLALLAARLLRSSLLKGRQSPFVMELPPYRTPTLKGLLIHTWERTWEYVKRAGTILLAVSLVVWALMSFPGLSEQDEARFASLAAQAQGEEDQKEIANQKASAELGGTVAGRLGRALTVLTDPLGFDWRTNVALVGGLAAKEVIVSTMGTAYSLGQGAKKGADAEPLAKRLQDSPGWTPLSAFALLVFVMIYSPCIATLVTIRRETGTWRWPLFSMVHNTLIAYLMALLVYQGGRALGLG